MNGFTLTELMVVIALMSVIAVAAFPLGVAFYNRQVLAEAETGVITALRTAQIHAMTQRHDTDHGVRILEDSYVLFEGSSYAARDTAYDHAVSVPDTFVFAGINEVVFGKFTGVPSATGTVSLAYGNDLAEISIGVRGLIE